MLVVCDTVEASIIRLHTVEPEGDSDKNKKRFQTSYRRITHPQSLSLDKISVAKPPVNCQGGFWWQVFAMLNCPLLHQNYTNSYPSSYAIRLSHGIVRWE